MTKNYRDVESKRGRNSFDPVRTASFRGKPCDLRRHFRKRTLLREMVSRADMMARNDKTGQRFIFETKWRGLLESGYSQSAIDRAERICEGSGILTPARCTVHGKELNGWIVIDHDKHRTLIGDNCKLDITLNSNPPCRKRGQRRWPEHVTPSLFPDGSGTNPGKEQSPLVSPFPSPQSPLVSPFQSPFLSPFPDDSESISVEDIPLGDNVLESGGERNSLPNPMNSMNPVNLGNMNPVNPEKENQESARPHSQTKPKPCGQDRGEKIARELVCMTNSFRTAFNKQDKQALESLLDKYPVESIKDLWQEQWERRKHDPVKIGFAVSDFLTKADLMLSQRLLCTQENK